jgi:hypothetical protein
MPKRPCSNQCPWLLVALLATYALALEHTKQPELPAWRGTWAATATQTHSFRGHWSAKLLPDTHNAVQGSWTLLNDANQIVLEGTWSAEKSPRGWRGTWSAEKSPRGWRGTWSARPAAGRRFSGTWTSDMPDFSGKSFEDMLQSTIEKQLSGSWRSGRMQGGWWLHGQTSVRR